MSTNFTDAIMELKLSETKLVSCECCKMKEEYTNAYIESIRNLYFGKFICGLCSEAVKYEMIRWGKSQRRIGAEEALAIQMRFRSAFIAPSRSRSPNVDFISTMGKIFKRRLVLDLPSVMTSEMAPGSVVAVDGGEICAAAVIGGSLLALPGGA